MGIIDSGRNKRTNIYKFVSAVPHIFLTCMVIKDFPKSSINYYANLYILVNFLYKCIYKLNLFQNCQCFISQEMGWMGKLERKKIQSWLKTYGQLSHGDYHDAPVSILS